MAMISVYSNTLLLDWGTICIWQGQLSAMWAEAMNAYDLTAGEMGTKGGLADFSVQFSSAFSALITFITGGDNPDAGALAALDCFMRTLDATKRAYDDADTQAIARVNQLS